MMPLVLCEHHMRTSSLSMVVTLCLVAMRMQFEVSIIRCPMGVGGAHRGQCALPVRESAHWVSPQRLVRGAPVPSPLPVVHTLSPITCTAVSVY